MADELRARRLHPGFVAGVLLLHVLLLAGMLRLGAWRDRGPAPPAERAPVLLWLLRPPDAAPAPAAPPAAENPARVQTAPPPPPTRPADARPAPAGPVREPQAITLPPAEPAAGAAPAPPAGFAGPSASAPQATTGAGATPAPLNLALPRGASAPWRSRSPALDDPRSNTPRATLETRLAEVLGGTDGITEERLDDGRMRLRRGTSCVIVHPNRAERLDPWNASVLPKMRGVESC